jgi:hypothetical protein
MFNATSTSNEPDIMNVFTANAVQPTVEPEKESKPVKFKTMIHINDYNEEMNTSVIDKLLENEKIHNKMETWNRIDKTVKTQKLHEFAERYGKEHALPAKDIKGLKMFFSESLSKNKLQKTKEVLYDKDRQIITAIPALLFNATNRSFTLRILDTQRVSTIKSLTPKRATNEIVSDK